jgi:hypothetical protein
MLILKSTDLIKLSVLTYCMQCLNVTIVACLTLLLKLDNINDNAIEQAAGLISTRTTTNIFLYLALDA